MSVGLVIELQVKHQYLQRFLVATRLYSQHTRAEPGTQLEVLKREAPLGAFLIRQIFKTEAAREAHAHSEHAREWSDTVAPFLDGEPREQRVALVVSEPPPLPRAPRPAALETSTELPRTHAEAVKWRLFGRAQPRRPSEPRFPAAALHLPRLQVAVERIEIASLHESFLRGAPEPCIVVSCYFMEGTEAQSLGRALYRFTLDGPAPCELTPRERLLDLPVLIESLPARLCVLLLAYEENGGSDIRAAYGDIADPAAFFVWSENRPEPDPLRIGDHAGQLRPNLCDRVQILREGEALHEASHDDTWVGAATGVLELSTPKQEAVLRFHARSRDGRNDWLTELSFRFA